MGEETYTRIKCDVPVDHGIEWDKNAAQHIVPAISGDGEIDACETCYKHIEFLIAVGLLPKPRVQCVCCNKEIETELHDFDRIHKDLRNLQKRYGDIWFLCRVCYDTSFDIELDIPKYEMMQDFNCTNNIGRIIQVKLGFRDHLAKAIRSKRGISIFE